MARPDEMMAQGAPGEASRLELLEAVVDALPLGVAVHDGNGRLVLANPAVPLELQRRPAGPDTSDIRIEGPGGERTILSAARRISVGGEGYVLSTTTDVTEQRQIENGLFDAAYVDALTGLANNALARRTIQELIDSGLTGQTFALAIIDVDNFRHINDHYGHAVGNEILVKFAQRLASDLGLSAERGETDMLARAGGDQFLLLRGSGEPDRLAADIQRVSQRLKQPFFVDGHEIFTSATIGVSLYPDHGRSYDALYQNAESAMYGSKAQVKGGIGFFEGAAHAPNARMELEQRLRLALRDHRFCCAFQPKVDIRTREVRGLEVLLRWRDENGQIRPPGDFVALAVELGLIDEITYIVLAETARAIDLIDDAFGPEVTISLNVAAKQADDVGFMRSFAKALADTGYAQRIMVEVTEEAFVAKSRFQKDVLPMLRAIGAKVSIDDFGVGYSSLSALADITADEIKVDRSFITEIHKRPRSQSVLKAVESLGHALGMTIIAEGVETFEELAYLEANTRIRYAQGYYFAKPMLMNEFVATRTMARDTRNIVGREHAATRQPQVRLSPARVETGRR